MACGNNEKLAASTAANPVPWRTAFPSVQPQGGGKDVFVRILAVEQAGLATLNDGQVVEYEEISDKGRTSAGRLKIHR